MPEKGLRKLWKLPLKGGPQEHPLGDYFGSLAFMILKSSNQDLSNEL